MRLLTRAITPLLVTPSCFTVAFCNAGSQAKPVRIRGSCRPDKAHPAPTKTGLALSSHWCLIPHPDKADKGGEDACYATVESVGVADGVGGWASSSIDAGLYSKSLMRETQIISEKSRVEFTPRNSRLMLPVSRLWQAYAQVQKQKVVGSTTATLVCLDGESATVHTLNLGDSGYYQMRQDENGEYLMVAYSLEQQHYFNCPYQLGTGCDDTPDHAQCTELSVEIGDLIILVTDGVSDNLFGDKILEIVNSTNELDHLAETIALEAHNVGQIQFGVTPFAIKARAVGYMFEGGKLDDVTVLVTQIVDTQA